MEKKRKTLMILASLLFWGSGIWALEQKDGVYQIGTAEDLVAFSDLVNNGEYSANAVLTTDIDLSGISYFPPIGKQYYPQGPELYFSGIFDGQGHIIYNLSIDKDDPGAETGLFGRLNGATVRNVGIVNATFKNSWALRAGVLAGCAVGSKVINCFTAGNIAMEECICEYNHRNGGGLLGLIASGAVVSNCYTTYGTICFDDPSATMENCYCGEDVANMAPTGKLCYQLNGDQQNIIWYQTIGEDAYPSFDSTHKQVYAIGDIKCDGTVLSEDASYTNDKDAASPIPPHNYVDGACIECGQFDPALVPVVDGWYEVGTPEQLLSISELVNGGKYDIKVRLTADIDLGGISYFPPIGKQYYPVGPTLYFSGTFDGQGHIIYNLSIDKDDPGAETGLFGRLNGATVQNVGIVNATFKNPHALRAGVLGACAVSSTIINCFTAGNIAMEECICEYENRNGGGLIGLITSGTVVSNCYATYGTLGAEAGVTTIQNCYWGEDVTNMAPTGELCYKLGPSFRQNIGEDNYPVLDATHGVVVQITGAGYATMYNTETAVTIPAGVEAFTGLIVDDQLWLRPLQNVIFLGQAVVLKGAAGYYSFMPTETNPGLIQSDLLGTEEPIGADGSQYILAQKDGVVGFYQAEQGTTIPAGKAYLISAAGVKGFGMDIVTSIQNSKFKIQNDENIYDLSGRRVEKMQKGIYIVNGKKYLK